MRRPATWLAIGIVLLVGVVAAADAVRQKASKPEVASTTTEPDGTTSLASPATGLSGVLYYTDEECRLSAVQLPDVRSVEGPAWRQCLFSLSPDAERVEPGGITWHPGGTVMAAQGRGRIDVFLQEGSAVRLYAFLGSAPSFDLQARLTFALGTEIRAMDAGCPLSPSDAPLIRRQAILRCSSVVLPREAVERAARRHPNADVAPGLRSVAVRETVWLGAQEAPPRLAALLRVRVRNGEQFDLIALFEDEAVVEVLASPDRLTGLKASPGGSYFGVLSQGPSALLVFDRGGREVTIPQAPVVNTFDWSPDEAWMAVSTPTDVVVFLTEDPTVPFRPLGLIARDLAWRSS